MTFLRFASFAAAAAASAVVACSSDSPAVAKVFLSASVFAGTHGGDICGVVPSAGGWVTLGDENNSVSDGDTQNGGHVTVTCTVSSNGDGTFNVNATGSVTGSGGGSVTIVGAKFPPPPGPVMNVRGVFQRGDTGKFEESDCTVDFSGNSLMGVAAGRVWGTLNCPNIQNMNTSVGNPPQPRTCAGTAEFKFENCQQ